MHALRMFHAAGSSLQILVSNGYVPRTRASSGKLVVLTLDASAGSAEGTPEIYSSLFWTCYKSERFVDRKSLQCLWYLMPAEKS